MVFSAAQVPIVLIQPPPPASRDVGDGNCLDCATGWCVHHSAPAPAAAAAPAPAPAKIGINPAAWMLGADGKPACVSHALPLKYHPDGKYGPWYSCSKKNKDGTWCKSKVSGDELTRAENS